MKAIILWLLQLQTKRFIKKHKPKIVAISGSVGKTSTKFFIATVLSRRYQVMAHLGNYNTEVSIPLTIFNVPLPEHIHSPFAWLRVLWDMEGKINKPFDYQVIIVELAADKPGDVLHFSKYLQPDVAVVTAVTPEHMQAFKTIDAVAQEELAVANFSKLVLINRDDIDAVFARYVQNSNIDTYGLSGVAEYRYIVEDFDLQDGFKGKLVTPEFGEQPVELKLIGEHTIKPAVAAAAVGIKLGLSASEISAGLQLVRPVKGRMRMLRGVNSSTLLDDTYNSSPKAAVAALQTLYRIQGKQKIAILGSMNELGEFSKQAHEEVGKACDPTLLDWLITVGQEAKTYLAPAAAAKGCQVRSFDSPYDAGAFAHSVLHPGAVVLAKGSQNGVFTEEAIKILLHSTKEEDDLVRQEREWMDIKHQLFEKFKDQPISKQAKTTTPKPLSSQKK